MRCKISYILLFALYLACFVSLSPAAEKPDDGYRLWMRYDPVPNPSLETYRKQIVALIIPGNSGTCDAIRRELTTGSSGLLASSIPRAETVDRDGIVIVGTPKSSSLIAELKLEDSLSKLGSAGYIIRSVKIGRHTATVIASLTDTGVIYRSFHFIRLLQTLQPIDQLDISEKPRIALRVLNHWDNQDGSIERGYAGKSLWNWSELPEKIDPRLIDYARANASLGINGAVLNNVNASAESLTPEYLRKTAAIADTLRPYGIRVYLTARFSAPIELGRLSTADPLDPQVSAWWKEKTDEIYKLIPDFGGFLIKANSEGQPGPLTYKRTHADGANMLAAAVAPHGGIIMWRAFVYASRCKDRIAEAYDGLKPFDGQFASNVLLQVKNAPLDFMPREPFHPLFGAMPNTQIMLELQIIQEYLGHSNHLAFLAPLWREALDSDTHAKGPNSTVAKVIDGTLYGQKLTGIAGVANTGSDRNWTGHDLAQANWYAFGRLAWNPDLMPKQIADEWIPMTLKHGTGAASTIARLLLESREAAVNYMVPLGLTHLVDKYHYWPEPWRGQGSQSFHRASPDGLGFDRTSKESNAVTQYNGAARERFADLAQCPEELLLWFHHVSWDYRMRSVRTMWDELCLHYQRGVDWTKAARQDWNSLSNVIDPDRHAAVAKKFAIQESDAAWWRDTVLLYFQTFSKKPFPEGAAKPQISLEDIKKRKHFPQE